MRNVVVVVVACGALLAALPTPARAQSRSTPASAVPVTAAGVPMVGPMLGPPQVTWLFGQGDANGGRGDTLGSGSIIFEPIRLALLSSSVPSGRSDDPLVGCGGVESTGNATASAPGFAMQHAAAFQLVPRLTLVGFARGGCQIDAGLGGAIVYATPIRNDAWLVASAGIFHLPQAMGKPVTNTQARVDLVLAQPKGRSYSMGVGTRGITFGGTL